MGAFTHCPRREHFLPFSPLTLALSPLRGEGILVVSVLNPDRGCVRRTSRSGSAGGRTLIHASYALVQTTADQTRGCRRSSTLKIQWEWLRSPPGHLDVPRPVAKAHAAAGPADTA